MVVREPESSPYAITPVLDGRVLNVETAGDLSRDAFLAMILETRDRIERTGVQRVLVDHTRATVRRISQEEIAGIASMCKALNQPFAGGRLAVVLISDLDYGLGRMWLSYAENHLCYESQLFRSRDAALQWLLDDEARITG